MLALKGQQNIPGHLQLFQEPEKKLPCPELKITWSASPNFSPQTQLDLRKTFPDTVS